MTPAVRVPEWERLPGPRTIRDVPIVGGALRAYEDRLTPRGKYLLWTLAVFALLGLDTRRTQVFGLFAAAAGLLLAATAFAVRRRPRVLFDCHLPVRATAGTLLPVRVRVATADGKPRLDLSVTAPPLLPRGGVSWDRDTAYVDVDADHPGEVTFTLRPQRRGRYLLRGPRVRACDPARLMGTLAAGQPDQVLLVYPRFWTMEEFLVPVGRRYQPGGIPLASNTGDAIEFVGTRDYREGDPVRNIHWRSWARRGQPVVKEHQEEYFCRLAIILDTFLPPKPSAADLAAFEATISLVASVADYFSRSEYVVDILAAGPDVYEVSAGRSLAYLENILDVLACLEPCPQPPFATIGPVLFDKLAQITTVVAVLQDWDESRETFLRRVRAQGSAVRALIVRSGPTTRPWQAVGDDLGEVSVMTPADVEKALAASAASPPGPRA